MKNMNLLYVYGHLVYLYNGDYYHPYLNSILERYKYFTNNITVCSTIVEENLSYLSLEELECQRINNASQFVGIDKLNTLTKLFNNENKSIIKREVSNSDMIITKLPSRSGEFAISCALDLKKPILVEMVGCPWDSLFNHSLRGALYAPYSFLRTKKYVRISPYVIYVTEVFLQSRYPTKGEYIGCSDVVIEAVSDDTLVRKINKIESVNVKKLSLCTLAGLDVKYKGQEYVIKALYLLNKKGYKCHYYLAGGGSGERILKLARKLGVEDQVHIVGPLEHSQVFNLLDTIDVYIQPSKQEGLPRALVEAMSRACPALGTRTGGIPELLSEKYLYNASDVKSLVNLISSLDISKMKKMAEYNFEKSKMYSADKLNKKRESFYEFFLKKERLNE